MKQTASIVRTLPALLCLLGIPSGLQAQTSLDFHVSLDTRDLATPPVNPFSVVYDLNNGSGADNGTKVTLDNFNFGAGGSWAGPTGVSLGEQAGVSDTIFIQEFIPGDTLSFDVHLFSTSDDPIPDLFTFALLDPYGLPLETSGSDFRNPNFIDLDAYLYIPFVSGTTLADIQAYDAFDGQSDRTLSERISVTAIPAAATPEGATGSLMLSGLAGVGVFAWRRRRSANVI